MANERLDRREQDLEELTRRLLTWNGHGFYGRPAKGDFFLGELPPGLPIRLPLPPGARLLGGFADPERPGSGRRRTSLVLDFPTPEVLSHLEPELVAQGWEKAEDSRFPAELGFASSDARFCRGPLGPELSIRVAPMGGGADVRIDIFEGHDAHVHDRDHQRPGASELYRRIFPPLQPPHGALMHPLGGMGGSNNRWTTQAIVATDLGTADLHEHFASQLVAAGWTPLVAGAARPVAGSTWHIEDAFGARWGFLLVVESAIPKQRMAILQVEPA